MNAAEFAELGNRLFGMLKHPKFLAMQGLANEVPLFVQAYAAADEDAMRKEVAALVNRLAAVGLVAQSVDLLSLVLDELIRAGKLELLLADERSFSKKDMFETLQNYSQPQKRLVPRLAEHMRKEGTHLTFITGSGRVFPFLRTHTILESLQPQMVGHPVVIFFPGQYVQEPGGGSSLRLFGTIPSPAISNPYYRCIDLSTHCL